MKLPIRPLEWLLGINLVYLVVGLADIYFKWWPTEYVQATWLLIVSTPLWIPMQRIVRIDPIWYEFKK